MKDEDKESMYFVMMISVVASGILLIILLIQ